MVHKSFHCRHSLLLSFEPIDPVERILSRQDEIRQARKAAEEKLAEAKDLEKQWQAKQAEMDQALKVLTDFRNQIEGSHFLRRRYIPNSRH